LGFTLVYARYYIPALPFVTILAVAAALRFSPTRWHTRTRLVCLAAALAAQVALIPPLFWNIPDRIPVELAFGLEKPEAFLSRALPVYNVAQYINRKVAQDEKVIVMGAANMRFYLEPPLATTFELGLTLDDESAPNRVNALLQDGYAYLVLNRRNAHDSSKSVRSYLSRFATLEYSYGNIDVYRIRRSSIESSAAREN
jgi:hypothetical protein